MRNPTFHEAEGAQEHGENSGMDEIGLGDDLCVKSNDWEESENGAGSHSLSALLTRDESTEYRTRWKSVQGGFVDEPRRTVEQADSLVDRVLKRLTEGLAAERDELVRQWDQTGEPVTTEDLRIALQGYRALLDRLLSASL